MTDVPEWLQAYEAGATDPDAPAEEKCPLTGGECPTDPGEAAKCAKC